MTSPEYVYSARRFNLLTALFEVVNHTVHHDTDAIIARYLLEHYETVEQFNIYDMASECFVSRASIQRFARGIGFEGFTDLKRSHAAISGHLDAVLGYATQPDFASTIIGQVDQMMRDIAQATTQDALDRITKLLHDADNVWVLSAATSHTGARQFQEEVFLAGRIVQVASDTTGIEEALSSATEHDLVVTVSTTGIFALAIAASMEGVPAHKLLLTMNEAAETIEPYDTVHLISQRHLSNPTIPDQGIRDVYTHYGMPFFLDLLSHAYCSHYAVPRDTMLPSSSCSTAGGPMPIKAVIFDMDGVLVDSEPAHQERIRQFFAEHGLTVPAEQLTTLVGCSGDYFVERATEWWAQAPRKSEAERTLAATEAYRLWKDRREPIDYDSLLNPGVRETLETLSSRGIRLAVASSTSHEGIRQELGQSDVLHFFEVVVSGEEFRESKPNPEIYLITMARMGLDPDECIAVEDSDRGIAAARAAGMRVAIKREPRFGFAQEGGTWYLDRVDELLAIVA